MVLKIDQIRDVFRAELFGQINFRYVEIATINSSFVCEQLATINFLLKSIHDNFLRDFQVAFEVLSECRLNFGIIYLTLIAVADGRIKVDLEDIVRRVSAHGSFLLVQ
jgi:hypothetical protein